jgi:hypothetical protein
MDLKRYELFDFVQKVGPMYGVEDFAIFLYALIRMHRPQSLIELGSGSGVCALLAARAMLENGCGKVTSIDNGSHWDKLRERRELAGFALGAAESYSSFMYRLAAQFEVSDHVEFVYGELPRFPEPGHGVDMVFSDYESHPAAIAQLLAFYLPRMNEASSIFIDGASTYLPSFLFLERLVEDLNRGKIPGALLKHIPEQQLGQWMRLSHTRRLTLVHLTERKQRDQNSTAWLKIEPVDHIPYPATTMR